MVTVRQMTVEESSRAQEIDVSETGSIVYEHIDGEIRTKKEEWQRPRWDREKWKRSIGEWSTKLHWDVMLGAFDGDRLVGMASLRYKLTETMAQLVSLHVSRDYRRQGVAKQLTQEIVRLARKGGARELYVSATPSDSAVGFYLSQGFRPTAHVNKQLYELEPEDIHMVRAL